MAVDAVTWLRTVEAAVLDTAPDHGVDPYDLLADLRFIERLDDAVTLDGDDLTEAVTEAVEDWAGTRQPESEDPDGERVVEAEDRIDGRVIEARGTDAHGGRVYRVRIIRTGESRNRKRYTEAVLRRAAPLYEGAKAYDHHRTPEELRTSTIAGLVGQYRGVGYTDDGLYGDLHLLPGAVHTAEALDASLAAQAQGLPPLVGISHDVVANFGPPMGSNRAQEAVAITRVHSADVVADPSAGGQAERVLAGGTTTDLPAFAGVRTTEGEIVHLDELLATLSTATPEQLAAHGLSKASTTTTTESTAGPSATGQRTVEADDTDEYGRDTAVGRLIIEARLRGAGLQHVTEAVVDALPERITERDVDNQIRAYKALLGGLERAGLAPTVTTEVTRESLDKKRDALDAFFTPNDTSGYTSFRQAYLDFTGYRPRAYDEDLSRRILRESFGPGFDSGERATESMDSTTWAQVLGDSVTRRLVAAYRLPGLSSWRQIVSNVEAVSDFRTQRVTRWGGYGELPTVNEGQPYQPLTSPGDEEATGALVKKGGTEDVTLEMIANDDRRQIGQIPTKLGRAAARTLYNLVWAVLSGNPTATYDSVALFHASHGNTDTSAGLAQTTLSTGRRKMIEQTAFGDSTEILGIPPKFIVVPPELEETAFMLMGRLAVPASNTVGASDQPNIHAGMSAILVPEFTDANDWFLVADPNDIPTIEVGFFNGRQEPEIFTQADQNVGSVFNADVFTWKVRFIFYVLLLDHRGFYRGQG